MIPGSATLRTVPSAGARHALETYLLVNAVEGLERGIYRFLSLEHRLVELSTAAGLADRAVSDDDMNRLLGLDGRKRFVAYLAAVGKKRD